MLSRLLRCALVFLIAASSLCAADAQSYIYDAGSPAYGVNIPIENGFINVTNGNLHMEFPIAQHPQRGNLKLNERLVYDSHFWKIGHYSNYYWWPDNLPRTAQLAAGWRFESGADTGSLSTNVASYSETNCQDDKDPDDGTIDTDIFTFTWTDPGGTVHPFNASFFYTYNNCNTRYFANPEIQTGVSTDSSGYTITISGDDQSGPQSYSIRDNYGTQVYPQIVDRYGNYWTSDSSGNLIDDRGQTPVITSYSGNKIYYDVLQEGGGRARYTVTTKQISPQTHFGEQDVSEYPNGSNAQVLNAVQSIQLPDPDGSTYSFTYDELFYGMITQVTLPTGGQVNYGWSNYFDSYQNVNRWLTSRTVGSDPALTFTPGVVTTCGSNQLNCHEKVTVHEPGGDETAYDMQLNNGAWNTNTKRYAGSVSNGTLASSTDTTYDWSNACGNTCNGSDFITAQNTTTTLADTGQMHTDVYTYANNQLGLLSAKKTYDFYTGSLPSRPLQQTLYAYANDGVPADLSKVAQTDGSCALSDFYNGNCNLISLSNYTYSTSAQSTSGLAGHDISKSLGVYPQSVGQWVNSDGSYITTNLFMDDAGFLRSQSLSAGGQTYGATTYSPDSSDTFTTTVTLPTGNAPLSTSVTPDATTGLPLLTGDYNGQPTNYLNYDSLNRVGEIDSADGGYKKYTYSPNTVFVNTRTQTGADRVTGTLLDGYGRLSRTAVATGQGSGTYWYQTDTCYNSNGQVAFASLPYAGPGWSQAPVCSNSGTQYTYDTFGRPLTITTPDGTTQYSYRGRATSVTDVNGVQRITQIDGLGRTSAVCEVTGNANRPSTGPGSSCNLDISATGFLTSYSYNDINHTVTVAQGSQGRTLQTDSLGRTVYTSEPESGVTHYTYTYNGTGQVVSKSRPQENQLSNNTATTTTTSQYDQLGRISNVWYSNSNRFKQFGYDEGTDWNGVSLGSSKGRMTTALTYVNYGLATGSWFSYDSMGRTTRTLECYPGGCGNAAFDILQSYNYDYTGDLLQSSLFPNGSSGTPIATSMAYSQAGEVSSITSTLSGPANDNGTLLSNVSQTPFGPQSYNLGDGFTEWLNYDAMGRNNARFLCNGTASSGCTQNNAQLYVQEASVFKGSRVLSREDSYLGGHGDFGYDEFNRLISSSYPQIGIAYTYSYDRYGNRTNQTVTQGSGPQPPFSFNAANQINGYTYDFAGNLLNDGMHSYQYDPDGNVISVDSGQTSTNYIDALNYRVRVDLDGTAKAYNYGPDGQRNSTWNALSSGTAAVLTANINFNGQPFAYWTQADDSGSSTKITVKFTNDAYTGAEDRNLYIDHILVGSQSISPSDPQVSYDNSCNQGGALLCNGSASLTLSEVGQTVEIDAHGTPVAGVYPRMQVLLNDVVVGEWDVTQYSGGYTVLPELTGGSIHYQGQDSVGSERWRTSSGQTLEAAYNTLAFGDSPSQYGSDDDPSHFAMLDHDNSSDTYHAQYRQYSGVQGRWMSPDPYSGSYDLTNPQSMNRYSYVMNNPLRATDPNGLKGCDDDCGSGDPDCGFVCKLISSIDHFFTGGGSSFNGSTDQRANTPMYTIQVNVSLIQVSSAYSLGAPLGVVVALDDLAKAPSRLTPPNPCQFQNKAQSPQEYARLGTSASAYGPAVFAVYSAAGFPRGSFLDAQPKAGIGSVLDQRYGGLERAAYGNYVYGDYMAAAGVPLSAALSVANLFAISSTYSIKNGPISSTYTHLPEANVANITRGYTDQTNGTLCHR